MNEVLSWLRGEVRRLRYLLAGLLIPGFHKLLALEAKLQRQDGRINGLGRATQKSDERLSQAVETVREEVAEIRRMVMAQGESFGSAMQTLQRLAFALSESGHFELASAFKEGEPATHAAICFTSREASIYVYRAAFMRALDYLRSVGIRGPVAEFGSYAGFTARCIAEILALRGLDWPLYLYDSFQGLPGSEKTLDEHSYEVAVNHSWGEGVAAVPEHYPDLIRKSLEAFLQPERIHIIKGYYQDTLPNHLPSEPLSLIHIDCDLYASTKLVLDRVHACGLLQDGCVILFDDYNCNRANPTMGERRALSDFLQDQPRWSCSPWFSYGWGGQAVFLHDRNALGG